MYLAEALKKTVGVNEYAPSRMNVQMKVNNLRDRIEKGERATIPKEEPYENRITQYLTEEELKRKINQGASAYKKGVQDEYDKLKLSVYDNSPEGQELYLQEARKQAEFMKLISDPTKIDQLMKADPAGLKAMLSEAELNRQVLDAKKQQHKLHELSRGNTKAAQSDANKEDEDNEEEMGDEEEKQKADEEEKDRLTKVKQQYDKIKTHREEQNLLRDEIKDLEETGGDPDVIDEKRQRVNEILDELKDMKKELKKIAKDSEIKAVEDLRVFHRLKDVSITQSGRPLINNRPASSKELKKYMDSLGFDYNDKDSVPVLIEKYNTQSQKIKDLAYEHAAIDPDAQIAADWARQWAEEHPDVDEAEARRRGYQVVDLAKRIANNPSAVVGNRYVYDENVRPITEAQQRAARAELDRQINAPEVEKRRLENLAKARQTTRERRILETIDRYDVSDRPEAINIVRRRNGVDEPIEGLKYKNRDGTTTFVSFNAGELRPADEIIENGAPVAGAKKTSFNTYLGHIARKPAGNLLQIPQNLDRAQKVQRVQQFYDKLAREGKIKFDETAAPVPRPMVNTRRMTEFGHGFKPLHKFPKDVITKSIHAAMNTPSFNNTNQHQYNREQAHHLTQMARLHMTGEGFFGDLRDKIGMWLFKNVHPAGRMLSYIQEKSKN